MSIKLTDAAQYFNKEPHQLAAILSTGTFDEEDLAEFAETLVAGRLDDIYALD